MVDTMYAQKERYKSVNKDLTNQIKVNEHEKANLQAQVNEKTISEESYKKGEKREKRKNKWIKGIATGFGVVAILESGWIFLTTRFSN